MPVIFSEEIFERFSKESLRIFFLENFWMEFMKESLEMFLKGSLEEILNQIQNKIPVWNIGRFLEGSMDEFCRIIWKISESFWKFCDGISKEDFPK